MMFPVQFLQQLLCFGYREIAKPTVGAPFDTGQAFAPYRIGNYHIQFSFLERISAESFIQSGEAMLHLRV